MRRLKKSLKMIPVDSSIGFLSCSGLFDALENLVMEVAEVGAVFKLGLQLGVVKLGWSRWCIQAGVFKSVCAGRVL
jgi:hypothetical protein